MNTVRQALAACPKSCRLRELVDQTHLASPKLRLLPLEGRVHFLVHSWSNNCSLEFQSAVLVAIRAAWFQSVTKRWCTVTAEVASSSLVVPAIPSREGSLRSQGNSAAFSPRIISSARPWVDY
jgi:hypothetical protein